MFSAVILLIDLEYNITNVAVWKHGPGYIVYSICCGGWYDCVVTLRSIFLIDNTVD